MDNDGFDSYLFIPRGSEASELKPDLQDDLCSLFINYAAVAWHEMRRAWRGDQSCASQRKPKESSLRRSDQNGDLILSKEPFEEPIPLSEMVEFLVESWEEEGLYD